MTDRRDEIPSYDSYCERCHSVTPHLSGRCLDHEPFRQHEPPNKGTSQAEAIGFPRPPFDPAKPSQGGE